MAEFTKNQIERQDFVDNEIYELLQALNPSSGQSIDWNIEMIAAVREKIRYWLVEQYDVTDERSFYPYLEE